MTIKDIAKQYNVAPKTIYGKLKKKGISIDSLRDADGRLSNGAYSVIASLFDTVGNNDKRDKLCNGEGTVMQEGNVITREGNTVTLETMIELAAAREKIKALEAENRLLREMVEQARQSASDWKQQAETAQRVQLAQIQLIPAKVGMWQRIKGVFAGNKADE